MQKMRTYSRDLIGNIRTSGEWKIHLTMKFNFALSKDIFEKRLMYFKSHNIEIRLVKIVVDHIEILLNT